jgi:N-terminal acetyltransferase B complex non-catalytic subunit
MLLKEYFAEFGDKACCFEDLKPFLGLEESDLSQFASFFQAVPVAFVGR